MCVAVTSRAPEYGPSTGCDCSVVAVIATVAPMMRLSLRVDLAMQCNAAALKRKKSSPCETGFCLKAWCASLIGSEPNPSGVSVDRMSAST